jgi:hypothetical protein
MPTITIQTAPLPARSRRLVALRLTRWLAAEGIAADHCVIRFDELREHTVFVGGLPVEALDRDSAHPAHAAVTCRISPERDGAFRARLATEITEALPSGRELPFLYLEFRPTTAADVWISRHGDVRRSDSPATASVGRAPAPDDQEDR